MLGLYRDNGKENGNYYIVYQGYIGIMEKKMETTIGFGFRALSSVSSRYATSVRPYCGHYS